MEYKCTQSTAKLIYDGLLLKRDRIADDLKTAAGTFSNQCNPSNKYTLIARVVEISQIMAEITDIIRCMENFLNNPTDDETLTITIQL